jgi:hypothetical protein
VENPRTQLIVGRLLFAHDPRRLMSRPGQAWFPLAQIYQPVIGSIRYSAETMRNSAPLMATPNNKAPR